MSLSSTNLLVPALTSAPVCSGQRQEVEYQICTGCGESKPLNHEAYEFRRDQNKFRTRCRSCRKKYVREKEKSRDVKHQDQDQLQKHEQKQQEPFQKIDVICRQFLQHHYNHFLIQRQLYQKVLEEQNQQEESDLLIIDHSTEQEPPEEMNMVQQLQYQEAEKTRHKLEELNQIQQEYLGQPKLHPNSQFHPKHIMLENALFDFPNCVCNHSIMEHLDCVDCCIAKSKELCICERFIAKGSKVSVKTKLPKKASPLEQKQPAAAGHLKSYIETLARI